MFTLLLFAQKAERSGVGGGSLWLIIAPVGDIPIDGLVVGAGVIVGGRQGLLLTIAPALELLFLGLSIAVVVRGARRSWRCPQP